VIFKYCDDNKMPLLDLKEHQKIINYITEEGKEEIKSYGKFPPRLPESFLEIIELEQQGAELFFGEMS
jgi:hypothetical protein